MYKELMREWSYYDDYEPTGRELFPEDPSRYDAWKARRGYGGIDEKDPMASASSSQTPIPPAPRADKPKPVKEKELQLFRKTLYYQQVRHGRCMPSSAATCPTEAQSLCPHRLEDLKWSANAEGHFARCKACDLKHVVYYSNRHGAMMVSQHQPPPGVSQEARVWIREDERAAHFRWVNNGGPMKHQVTCRVTKDVHGNNLEVKFLKGDEEMNDLTKPIDGPPRALLTEFWYELEKKEAKQSPMPSNVHYIQAQKPGLAIADSGCRNSVGGEVWHQHFQDALRAHGIPWEEVAEKETYKFGAGAPIVSQTACLYPVLIHGQVDVVRMSVVGKGGAACPGLIGPGELSRWDAIFHFKDKQMELNGLKRETRLTATRHPGIELMEFHPEEIAKVKQFWQSEEAEKKRKILKNTPHSYAFLTTEGEEDETEDDDTEEEEVPERDDRQRKVEEWTQQLEDLGVTMVPTVPALEEEEEASSSAMSDGHDSSTSHEKGVDMVTDDSDSEEEGTKQAPIAESKIMHKGLRHRLGHVLSEIKKTFQGETKAQRKKEAGGEDGGRKEEVRRGTERKRPWTIVEIFSWTCAISMVASMRGWNASEPISLPHWDLLKGQDRAAALQYLDQLDPDVMVIAWPCTVWSPLQVFGNKSPWQRERLEERREEQRELLGFVRDASHGQRRRGGLLLGENPKPSLAWREPLIVEAFDGMGSIITDMCQYGLRIPEGGPFLRKRTRLEGTPELLQPLAKLCPGTHEHTPVLGGMRHQGKWMNVSDFAGGYTSRFAQAVVKQAEKVLEEKGRRPEALLTLPAFPEEDLDEEAERTEVKGSKEEQPQSWRIQQLHNRLGHPTNSTLSKMLSLAGASKEIVNRAQDFQCPTCQETQPPGRYLKASAEMRTTIFGKELHCDLKYLHDHKNALYVALSMVDSATSFHQAVLLRNRSAEHVARKCLRHWFALFGTPQTIVLDQGGEFDGYFTGFLEQHGVHSKVSGSKSAWQHGFAERHGALLGTMFTSLAWQYKVEGRSQVKDALCAAVQAKNSTLTKGGYTPFQLAFGRQPMFPDLLEEDVEGNMSLREALSLEGEVQRASEMRAAARATLLRHDVQSKLRRALRRWPKGEEREFEPGELVYFYAPKPLSTRFKKEPGFWRGPAMVLAKESHQKFFISWRGRCLLVSAANLRSASRLEGKDHDKRLQEGERLEESWKKGEKQFEDMSTVPEPVEEEKTEALGWEAHDGVVSRKPGGRPKSQAKEIAAIAKTLRGMKTIKTIQKHRRKKEDRLDLRSGTTKPIERLPQEEAKPSDFKDPQEEKKDEEARNQKMQQIQEEMYKWLGKPQEDGYQDRLRQHLIDDVPMQFKRKHQEEPAGQLSEEQLVKRFRPSFFAYTMLASINRSQGE